MLSNETIQTAIKALEHYDSFVRDLIGMAFYHDSPDNGASELDKIAQAKADLAAHAAQGEWTPVDYQISDADQEAVTKKMNEIYGIFKYGYGRRDALTLCRRTAASVTPAPVAGPDWNSAPEWSNWWQGERIAAIQARLRSKFNEHPEAFWEELNATVAFIVMGCVDAGDTEWPADLHLADVVDKHLNRHIGWEEIG